MVAILLFYFILLIYRNVRMSFDLFNWHCVLYVYSDVFPCLLSRGFCCVMAQKNGIKQGYAFWVKTPRIKCKLHQSLIL